MSEFTVDGLDRIYNESRNYLIDPIVVNGQRCYPVLVHPEQWIWFCVTSWWNDNMSLIDRFVERFLPFLSPYNFNYDLGTCSEPSKS